MTHGDKRKATFRPVKAKSATPSDATANNAAALAQTAKVERPSTKSMTVTGHDPDRTDKVIMFTLTTTADVPSPTMEEQSNLALFFKSKCEERLNPKAPRYAEVLQACEDIRQKLGGKVGPAIPLKPSAELAMSPQRQWWEQLMLRLRSLSVA